jgi:hypothetical protein
VAAGSQDAKKKLKKLEKKLKWTIWASNYFCFTHTDEIREPNRQITNL